MKKNRSSIIDYQIPKNYIRNKNIKTTNINVLLNRVRQEKKNNTKKKTVLLISIITFILLFGILAF
jgi:uncharacterized membrane protein YvbJ